MTLNDAMKQLKALGDDKRKAFNAKHGAGENQFGVPHGEIRALAKKIKANHALGLELWKTGNIDAQFLAILLIKPKELTESDLDALVRSITYQYVADWANSYIVKPHPAKLSIRERWMDDSNPMAARAGWSVTADLIAQNDTSLDLPSLLDRLEAEMESAHPHTQWTMNSTLAQIGIANATLRKRAIAIGEKLGVYRDYPVSKGCTSPFAPIWINEMVKRKG